jgi:hypothetical protein
LRWLNTWLDDNVEQLYVNYGGVLDENRNDYGKDQLKLKKTFTKSPKAKCDKTLPEFRSMLFDKVESAMTKMFNKKR